MRKAEAKLLDATYLGVPFKSENTVLEWEQLNAHNARHAHVYLHGNKIAELHYSENGVLEGGTFWHCGWATPTTMSRLNALARGLDLPYRFGIRNRRPVFDYPKTGVINAPFIDGLNFFVI